MSQAIFDAQTNAEQYFLLIDTAFYKEFFLVVGCTFRGVPASRCVFIWVDKDFAMMRGWIQGFPKKLGAIHMTRVFPVGRATPRIEAGARFGATCTAGSREIARAIVTLRNISATGPTVNDPPSCATRLRIARRPYPPYREWSASFPGSKPTPSSKMSTETEWSRYVIVTPAVSARAWRAMLEDALETTRTTA